MSMDAFIRIAAIANAAIAHQDCIAQSAKAKGEYYTACREWKDENGYDRYQKLEDEAAWQSMVAYAMPLAQVWTRAKKDEHNAKRRLLTAIRRHRAAVDTATGRAA